MGHLCKVWDMFAQFNFGWDRVLGGHRITASQKEKSAARWRRAKAARWTRPSRAPCWRREAQWVRCASWVCTCFTQAASGESWLLLAVGCFFCLLRPPLVSEAPSKCLSCSPELKMYASVSLKLSFGDVETTPATRNKGLL